MFVMGIKSCDVGDGDVVLVAADKLELVTDSDCALAQDREIKARTTARQKSLENICAPELDAELVTGHTRLCDHHLRLAHTKAVADVEARFIQALGREILAEHAEGKLHLWQLAAPEFVMFRRITVDG